MSRRQANLTGLVLIACSLLPGALQAAAWDWQSQVRLTGRSNDNPTLRIEDLPDGTPSAGKIVSATSLNGLVEFDLIRSTPNSRIEITPRVSRSYYPDDAFKELENTDWFIFADGAWNRELTNWNLGLRYEDVSLLSNEDQGGGGTGGSLFRVDDTRTRASIAPNFSWLISPRDTLQLGATYTEVDYALDFTGRADGDFTAFSLNYFRAFTERQNVSISAFVNQSRSQQLLNRDDPYTVENDFDGLNLNLGYTFNITEDFSASIRYGRQETDTRIDGLRFPGIDPGDNLDTPFGQCADIADIGGGLLEYRNCENSQKSNTYALDIDKAFELSRIGFTLSQRITPNSAGSPTERIQAQIDYERDLSERVSIDALLTAYEQKTVNTEELAQKNTNIRAEISIDWIFTRNWAVGAEYKYRFRENSTDSDILPGSISFGEADSNEFGFFIRYFIERAEL